VKVVVTRAAAQAEPLVSRLEALGHEVVRCPLIRVDPLADDPLDLSSYDWVAVTSPNGADEIARRLASPPRHFAAIGPATAEALRGHGYEPELVARVHTQEGLRDELPAGRTLLAAAEGARQGVLDADFLPLYRTVELTPPAPEGDVALLASASAARGLAATGARLPVVSIGPQTSQAAREAGFEVVAEAATYDLDGLLSALQSL
jgi:uroporphyrinogen III methyltransferase/synthase